MCVLWVWISITLTQGACGKDEPQDSEAAAEQAPTGSEENEGSELDDADDEPEGKRATRQGPSKGKTDAPQRPGADDPDDVAPSDETEQRKSEREQRIEELRKRNDARRQERLTRRAEREGTMPNPDEPANEPSSPPEIKERPKEKATKDAAKVPGPTRVQPTEPKAPAMPLNRFLALKEVREVMGNSALQEKGPLPGIEATEWYNSVYYSGSKNKKYGVGLQVWRETTRRNAHERYKRMRKEYNNPEDVKGVTAKTFFSYWGDIMVLTFADLTKRVVVSVSCGQSVGDTDKLFKLAKTVQEKL